MSACEPPLVDDIVERCGSSANPRISGSAREGTALNCERNARRRHTRCLIYHEDFGISRFKGSLRDIVQPSPTMRRGVSLACSLTFAIQRKAQGCTRLAPSLQGFGTVKVTL